MSFNKLLDRQIKKYLPEDYYLNEHLTRFIQAVHDSYEEYERDRKLFNHAFACSEHEYMHINEKLKREATLKHASIQQLKETISKFKGTNTVEYSSNTDDLSDVINYLEHELQEKKKADDLLQQSEKRLRLALQTIDDNVWEYHFPTRQMTFAVNEKSILDLDKNVFEGNENSTWWQTILEEDRHIAIETFRQYMNGEITRHCVEYRVKLKDGKTKWILNRGGVIRRSKTGKPITIIGTLTDIQNFKNIQGELTATANRLTHLIKNLQTGVLLEDENGNVVLTNKKFTDFFNYPGSPETLVGIGCTELYESSTHLFKYPDEFISKTEKHLKEREPVNNEELRMADGRVLERNYIPLFIDDTYRGHLWTYEDITERKRSEIKLKKQEEKYRSIIANMNLGLIEVDLEEKIRYVNHSFCLMSGYEEHELIGKNAADLFVKDEYKDIIDKKNSLRHQGLSDAYEMNVNTKNSDAKWWLVCGAPLYNDKQQLVGSIGIHLDIT
ncbi:MAG TPA: PAS domain S-box protein, partial [Niastella sp.]